MAKCKFNSGDKVKLIDSEGFNDNLCLQFLREDHLVVESCWSDGENTYLSFRYTSGENQGKVSGGWDEDRFELIVAPRKFKVGDVVKCIDGNIYANLYEGERYIVKSISEDPDTVSRYFVAFSSTDSEGWYEDRFELVERPTKEEPVKQIFDMSLNREDLVIISKLLEERYEKMTAEALAVSNAWDKVQRLIANK